MNLGIRVSARTATIAWVNFPASGSCYRYGDPMSYTGDVAMTIYGEQCASWHTFANADFPDSSVQAASNYCRNPRNEQTGPWCYDINDKMGHCNVLLCSTAGRCSLSSLLIKVVTITNTYQQFICCIMGFWRYEVTQISRKAVAAQSSTPPWIVFLLSLDTHTHTHTHSQY